MDNFIGIYENALPDQVCDDFVRFFEDISAAGLVSTRQQLDKVRPTVKQDRSGFASKSLSLLRYTQTVSFYTNFWANAYTPYAERYAVLYDYAPHNIYDLKIQKTEIGEGYHVWHCENMDRASDTRVLAFTAYLNDVEVGGETEFLYYPLRIPPKKGTICLFPAGFTHTHRGNPPISNTKYIITGWIEF